MSAAIPVAPAPVAVIPESPPALGGLLTTLTDHRMTSVDAARLREAAARDEIIVLDVGYTILTFKISFEEIRAPGYESGWMDANGTFNREYPVRPNTYSGHLVGSDGTLRLEDSEIRLVLDDDNVRGFLRDEDVSYNLERADFPVLDNKETVVYRNTDVAPWGMGSTDIDIVPEGAHSSGFQSDFGAAVVGSGTIKIALYADPEYAAQFGGYAQAVNRMEGDFHLVKGIFGSQFGYTFLVSYTEIFNSDVLESTTDANTILQKFADYANSRVWIVGDGVEWRLAHLFTYRVVTSSEGTVYGVAWENAVATRYAVSLTQQKNENYGTFQPESNGNHRKWTIAHENGHVLGGNHCRAEYKGWGSWTKTIMAAWGWGDGCDGTPALPYTYNYVDYFSSNGPARDNVGGMAALISPRLGPSPTPSAPTGPGAVQANVANSFTFPAAAGFAGQSCQTGSGAWYQSYLQIDWGNGVTAKPGPDDGYCGSKQVARSYANAGTYDVRVRVKFGYMHEWSAWSAPFQVSVSCPFPDPGANCDAANDFAGAAFVSAGTFNGYIVNENGVAGDYYRFAVPQGSSISITMTPASCVNYDLRLYNPSNALVATSANTGCQQESVSVADAVTGDWRIRVYPVSGAFSATPYAVTLAVTSPQPPTAQISSPANGATVSGTTTVSGTAAAFEGRTVQRVEYRIDSGAWQTATGTTSWSFPWNTIASGNGAHTVSVRAYDGTYYTPAPQWRTYTVSNGGGATEIARHDGFIQSAGENGASGTFITFNGVSSGGPLAVTYKYCYLGNSHYATGSIRTVFDGIAVDTFEFKDPYTGGGTCTEGNINTYATATFEITSGVANSIQFGYTNGDWRLSIANILVTVPGGGSGFTENFENGATGWSATGFWHLTTNRAHSPSNAMWYGQASTGNYANGASNSGGLTSPAFTVPSGTPQLRFQSWYQTEDTGTFYDKKVVEISTNGGSTWTQIGQVSGTPQTWLQQTISMSTYAGQSVNIRFYFDTVDSAYNDYEGWYVDSVQVS